MFARVVLVTVQFGTAQAPLRRSRIIRSPPSSRGPSGRGRRSPLQGERPSCRRPVLQGIPIALGSPASPHARRVQSRRSRAPQHCSPVIFGLSIGQRWLHLVPIGPGRQGPSQPQTQRLGAIVERTRRPSPRRSVNLALTYVVVMYPQADGFDPTPTRRPAAEVPAGRGRPPQPTSKSRRLGVAWVRFELGYCAVRRLRLCFVRSGGNACCDGC